MAKRDPNKTARNRIIASLTTKLREIMPDVLDETELENQQSLNAKIGSRNDDFFNLQNDVINSQDQFASLWLQGLKKSAKENKKGADYWLWNQIKKAKNFKNIQLLF